MFVRVHGVGFGHRTVHVLPDVERPVSGMLAPPAYQRIVVGRGMPDFPIHLRDVIIHPTFFHPFQHIGIEIVIVLQSARIASPLRVALQVTIDTERRHAELHPRLDGMDAIVQLTDEKVHILPSPVIAVHSVPVTCIRLVVRDAQTAFGIRIKVIVDMNAIHVITQQDVRHDVANVVPVLRHPRIHNQLFAIPEIPPGMLSVIMCGSQFLRTLRFGPVRIDPGMQLHTPCMTLGYHPLQRIPIGRRRRALLSGQITAPRFEAAGIKRVELGAHLKQNGIDTALLQFIQLVRQRTLHLCRTQPHKLIVHTLYPCAAKLPFGRQLGLQRKAAKPHHQKQK